MPIAHIITLLHNPAVIAFLSFCSGAFVAVFNSYTVWVQNKASRRKSDDDRVDTARREGINLAQAGIAEERQFFKQALETWQYKEGVYKSELAELKLENIKLESLLDACTCGRHLTSSVHVDVISERKSE